MLAMLYTTPAHDVAKEGEGCHPFTLAAGQNPLQLLEQDGDGVVQAGRGRGGLAPVVVVPPGGSSGAENGGDPGQPRRLRRRGRWDSGWVLTAAGGARPLPGGAGEVVVGVSPVLSGWVRDFLFLLLETVRVVLGLAERRNSLTP
jgi:hypothetical protein